MNQDDRHRSRTLRGLLFLAAFAILVPSAHAADGDFEAIIKTDTVTLMNASYPTLGVVVSKSLQQDSRGKLAHD